MAGFGPLRTSAVSRGRGAVAHVRPSLYPQSVVDSSYPFVPKSTTKLRPGDFWPVPLSDGSYASGLVLQKAPSGTPGARVSFCGALLDWNGRSQPDASHLTGAALLAQGYMHVLAITNFGSVLGNLGPAARPVPQLWHDGCRYVLRGYDVVRRWGRDDKGKIPALEYWGWDIIQQKAEELLLNSSRIERQISTQSGD